MNGIQVCNKWQMVISDYYLYRILVHVNNILTVNVGHFDMFEPFDHVPDLWHFYRLNELSEGPITSKDFKKARKILLFICQLNPAELSFAIEEI